MVKSIRHTDLASEEPGARADVGLQLDEVSLEAEVPLAAGKLPSTELVRSRYVESVLLKAKAISASDTVWRAL